MHLLRTNALQGSPAKLAIASLVVAGRHVPRLPDRTRAAHRESRAHLPPQGDPGPRNPLRLNMMEGGGTRVSGSAGAKTIMQSSILQTVS